MPPASRSRGVAGYVGKKIADTCISTATAFVLTLAIAVAGVGAVKGDVQQGFEVPGEIVDGFSQLVRAAEKYLGE
jgi:hypothetical protein